MENWYEVRDDVTNVKMFRPRATRGFACSNDIADAETGTALPYFVAINELRRASVTLDVDGVLGDRLFTMGGALGLIISPRALDAIQALRMCPSFRWIPIEVLSTKRKLLAEYYWAHGASPHEVWDLERSSCLWVDAETGGGRKLATVHSPGVLREALVPPLDLFLADSSGWVCTQAFKDAIENVAATGFQFLSLAATPVSRSSES